MSPPKCHLVRGPLQFDIKQHTPATPLCLLALCAFLLCFSTLNICFYALLLSVSLPKHSVHVMGTRAWSFNHFNHPCMSIILCDAWKLLSTHFLNEWLWGLSETMSAKSQHSARQTVHPQTIPCSNSSVPTLSVTWIFLPWVQRTR